MDVEAMPNDAEPQNGEELYDGPCVAGCQHFHGGEVRHDPNCGHYPQSLTKSNADTITALQAENERLREALEEMTEICTACTFDNIRIRGQYVNRNEAVGRARSALATAQENGNE